MSTQSKARLQRLFKQDSRKESKAAEAVARYSNTPQVKRKISNVKPVYSKEAGKGYSADVDYNETYPNGKKNTESSKLYLFKDKKAKTFGKNYK